MDGLAQQFLEHPRRAWFVWGAVGAVALALTLPAGESLWAAAAVRATLASELAAARAESARLPELKTRFEALKADAPADGAVRGMDDAAAETLREAIVRKIAADGLRYRRLTLDGPAVGAWGDGPPPLPGLTVLKPGRGRDVPGTAGPARPAFEVVTRRLTAEAVGSAKQVAGLLEWAATAHPHAAPVGYELKFEDDADPAARGVHLTFTLLLTAVRPVEKPAAGA